jgi:hypothetical protein
LPPLSQRSAYANLLLAVTEARQAMVALNEKNSETGRAPLNYGIGVHVGDVMYGNIGSRARLDFTVIGPAVNMASRLETLTKQLGRTVLLSRAFADFVESDFDLERVGEYPVRGFNDPIELFAVEDLASKRSCIQSDVREKFKTSSTRSWFSKTPLSSQARYCASTVARAPVTDQNGAAAGAAAAAGTLQVDMVGVRSNATRMPPLPIHPLI